MFKFILATLFSFICLRYVCKKKKSLLHPSTLLLLLYFISIFLSYPHIILNNEKLSLKPEYLGASILFLVLLFLFFYPFISYREDKIEKIILPNSALLYSFSITMVFLSLFSIVYFIPTVMQIFSMASLNDARLDLYSNGPFVQKTIFNTIASVSASFSPILIFLFFIYRAKQTNKKLSIFLLISSVSYVFNVLAYVGRDGVVFWLFSFFGIFFLFKDFLPKKDIKKIKFFLCLFMSFFVPLFMLISIDRFSGNLFGSLLSYIGQPFPNFCLAYHAEYPVSYGSAFPLFREILGLPEILSKSQEYGGTNSWVFGTFLKSLIVNFDLFFTIIIGIFMSVIFSLAFNKSSRILYFHQLFLYFLYFQIFIQGVFYFKQYTRGGNLFIILSFLFYILFLFIRKHHNINSIVIYKKE